MVMSRLLGAVRRHPLVTFFVLTYAISWGLIPFWTFQAGGPFIAAFVVIRERLLRGRSRIPNVRFCP